MTSARLEALRESTQTSVTGRELQELFAHIDRLRKFAQKTIDRRHPLQWEAQHILNRADKVHP